MDRSAATYWTSSWAEPHARGDGPTKEGALTGTDSRAPRTWGWTAGTGKRPGSSPPSPTHVGMDRFPEQGPQSSRAEPHARGDGPPRQGTDPPSTRRAPRTWGWTAASGTRSAEHAPSRLGACSADLLPDAPVHPRVRGARRVRCADPVRELGPSPRPWGSGAPVPDGSPSPAYNPH